MDYMIYTKKSSEDNKSIHILVFLLERIKLVMFITRKQLVSLILLGQVCYSMHFEISA